MLRKQRLHDGGIDVETVLLGPAVFLDVWAVRELSRTMSSDIRDRFTRALKAQNASVLVSSAWVTELDTLQGDARTRAETFFRSVGAHWLMINPVVSSVAAREARDEVGAYLSDASLRGYISDRCGELLRNGIDPHTLGDSEFFDLSRTLIWTAADPIEAAKSAALAQALKDAARTRAEADRDEQRRDRTAHERLYPTIPWQSGKMIAAHNAVWREVTRRSPGRTWVANDGFDIAHLIPALTLGGFIAVDTDWKRIGQLAAHALPAGHARFYRPGELELLVRDIEGL